MKKLYIVLMGLSIGFSAFGLDESLEGESQPSTPAEWTQALIEGMQEVSFVSGIEQQLEDLIRTEAGALIPAVLDDEAYQTALAGTVDQGVRAKMMLEVRERLLRRFGITQEISLEDALGKLGLFSSINAEKVAAANVFDLAFLHSDLSKGTNLNPKKAPVLDILHKLFLMHLRMRGYFEETCSTRPGAATFITITPDKMAKTYELFMEIQQDIVNLLSARGTFAEEMSAVDQDQRQELLGLVQSLHIPSRSLANRTVSLIFGGSQAHSLWEESQVVGGSSSYGLHITDIKNFVRSRKNALLRSIGYVYLYWAQSLRYMITNFYKYKKPLFTWRRAAAATAVVGGAAYLYYCGRKGGYTSGFEQGGKVAIESLKDVGEAIGEGVVEGAKRAGEAVVEVAQ